MKIIVAIFLCILFFSKPVKCAPVYQFSNLQIDTIEQPYLMPWGESEPKKKYTFSNCFETKPEFPVGDAMLFKFIRDNIQYPKFKGVDYIGGKVFVGFIVNSNGSISDVKVLSGLEKRFDEEAVRVVKLMPNWIPSRQQQLQNLKVRYTLPIRFHRE